MVHLIRFDSVLRYVVLAVVIVSVSVHVLVQSTLVPDWPFYKIIPISSTVAAVLIYVMLSSFFYRKIWRIMRKWNSSVFHDLNGTWRGTIYPSTGGALEVQAVIRHSLLFTQIDLHGQTVKSTTLAAAPMIEAGQHRLYYVYYAEPRQIDRPPYTGTTKFTVRNVNGGENNYLALSGQYYTDRDTCGTIDLQQLGSDPSVDVSFY